MIEKILPNEVISAELFHDPEGTVLFAEEEAVISRAVRKRRNEFTSARVCARQALVELGHAPVPLVPGERGAPTWPSGVVGSMTHCAGYRAAALAHSTDLSTIGIDAEPAAQLPDGVLEAVSLPEEREWCARSRERDPDVPWDRLLFSAKESVYKAWFPLTRRWLGFGDAELSIEDSGTFTARLLVDTAEFGSLEHFNGRWLSRDGLLITAITRAAD